MPLFKNFKKEISGVVVKAKTCFASFPEFFDEACQKKPIVLFEKSS